MGSWGTGTYDNDTAGDWVGDLADTDDLSLIEATLDQVLDAGSDYLESPEAEEALAAADVIARLQGNPGESSAYTEDVETWVAEHPLKIPPDLAHKAVKAIDRILKGPSELLELWEEGEEVDDWRDEIKKLKARIKI